MYHWFNVGIMKDTWNVYDWGKNLVNDRFRLISNLLLLFIILFLGFQNVYGDFTREGFLYAYPVSILVFAFPIYLNIYWLVPRFLYKAKRKLWCYWISFLGVNLVSVLLGFIFLSPLYQRYGIRGFCIQDNHAVSFDSIAYGVLVLLLSAGGCTSFELFRRWVVSDKKILELEKATKQAELQQLKKQINPHFLFNMLNNANILVKDAPDEASQILEKLDNLLRYQLNDSTRREVFLTADIQFLTSFLELEKVRRDHFEYTIFQEGNMENICIPPLLFIPFVENAVKHNLDSDNLSYVHLYFSVHNEQLTFRCENSKPRVPVKREGGIGLANVKRRLDLLYESRYTLQIEDKETTYNVNLHLNL